MKTKNQNNVRIISSMLPIIALFVLSCNNSNKDKPADTPKDTTATATVPAPAPDPAAPFYGTWEREENGVYSTETFGKATKDKDGEKYTGAITEQNLVIADYTVHGNSIEIAYNNSSKVGAHTTKFDFSVSNGGNRITLDSKPPIVYNKGSQNTSLQDEAYLFNTPGGADTWSSLDGGGVGWNFRNIVKADNGWSGTFEKWNSGTVTQNGEFNIPSAGSITMKPVGVAPITYEYKFKNSNKILELIRDGNSQIFKRP